MRLIIKQLKNKYIVRYNLYDASNHIVFTAKDTFSFTNKKLNIYDQSKHCFSYVTLKDDFNIYVRDNLVTTIKEYQPLESTLEIDNLGWIVVGDISGFNFHIMNADKTILARVSKRTTVFDKRCSVEIHDDMKAEICIALILTLSEVIDKAKKNKKLKI